MKKFILVVFVYQHLSFSIYSQSWVVELDSVLSVLEHEEIFSGQILIAEQGKILFQESYGQYQNGKPITIHSPLELQSVSKAFTALCILILKDRGHLSLDDPITKYFPRLSFPSVSIKHLLNMTSGLPRLLPLAIQFGDTTKAMSNTELIEILSEHKPMAKTAGEMFSYNTDNYILLASVVEKISGCTYQEFVEKNIFEPLEMNNSYVHDPSPKIGDSINSYNFYAVYGDGNIRSSAEDLYIFERTLQTNKLIQEETQKELFQETKLNDGSLSNYAFSWTIIKKQEGNEVSIVGDGENTRASIQRFRDGAATLIYIHNLTGSYWSQVYPVVRNIWEGKDYRIPTKKKVYPINTNLYKYYTGSYLTKTFGLLHITTNGKKLFLRPDPIPGKEELIPSSDTTFYFENQSIEWEFFKDVKGNVIGLGIRGRSETMGPKQ